MIRNVVLSMLVFLVAGMSPGLAAVREYHLTIAREKVVIQNRRAEGMTINGHIPGPTLYFDRGDLARRRAALIGKWHSEYGFGGGLSLIF